MRRKLIRCASCGEFIDYSDIIDGDYFECEDCGALFCMGCTCKCVNCGKNLCEKCEGHTGCNQCGEPVSI
jgi:hypothetical protein